MYKLNWRDLLNGLLMAVAAPVFTVIIESVNAGSLKFDWNAIGITALSAALAYLKIKFFTPSQTIIKK
jgi:bacteriorhodopsin